MKPSVQSAWLIPVLLVFSCITAAADSTWVEQSDAITETVMTAQAKFQPETFSGIGISAVDAEIMDLEEGLYERSQEELLQLLALLEERKRTTENPRVIQDINILIKSITDQYHTTELNHKYMLPYYNLSQALYFGFQSLLDPRNEPSRYAAALERLKQYTGQAPDSAPITQLARERTRERFSQPGLLGPYREQLEKDLQNVERYRAGLQQVFEDSGLEGWQENLALLILQLDEYAEWLTQEMLPRARDQHQLPEELYADNLKNFGVDMEPRQLIAAAQLGFADIQFQMQAIARQIAEQNGYASSDYRAVLKELSKEQIEDKNVLPFYRDRLGDLEAIIRENELVSLPERPAVIRLATEAESAAVPAPFMSPPQLIGNTGQPGEFVLVTSNPGDDSGEAMNDFGSAASTWSLTAHEARPGHEMQFAAMLESGVSQARAIYAFNSANVEGWGLYAEAIMQQYLPLDGQLFGLKGRLMRAARAFLDPMLNLGLIAPEQALDFIINEVGLSRPLALQEVDRYTFRAPGQATSYYYGYMNLMSLRTEVELRMRDAFNQREYHDFLLAQGLLPPDILRAAVLEDFVSAATPAD
ncbi:MAG TPA: DUF885 domain-containing protein [Xanthomonadales bacterium]|nr:DUF885 domain-containing protein [Xanthomonadales bacterium]